MALTVRDLKIAADHQRQLQLAADAIRMAAIVARRIYLQDMAAAGGPAAQVVLAGSIPTVPGLARPPVVQLVLHALFTAVMAALVIAYLEANCRATQKRSC